MSAVAKVVEAVKILGPRNISTIASYANLPKETCRYIVTKRLGSLGFTLRIAVDFGAIGLSRILVRMNISDSLRDSVKEIMEILVRTAYLHYYARLLPSGKILTLFCPPPELKSDLYALLQKLANLGVIKEFQTVPLAYSSTISMRHEYFDFDRGEWDIHWNEIHKVKAIPVENERPESANEIDAIDLAILRNLQVDATRRMSEVAKFAGISRAKVIRHYRDHVLGRRMVKGCHVDWFPPAKVFGPVVYSFLDFECDSQQEVSNVRDLLYSSPYTYSEMRSRDGSHIFGFMACPTHDLMNSLGFLTSGRRENTKCEFSVIDLQLVDSFTVHDQLFDGTQNKWRLSITEVSSAMEAQTKKMGGAGP